MLLNEGYGNRDGFYKGSGSKGKFLSKCMNGNLGWLIVTEDPDCFIVSNFVRQLKILLRYFTVCSLLWWLHGLLRT